MKIPEKLEAVSEDIISIHMRRIRRNNIRKGWRGIGAPPRTFGDEIALMHSELSEALEAFRECGDPTHGQYSIDKAGNAKPEGVPSELADVYIRLLDVCYEYRIDLVNAIETKLEYNEGREFRHGGKAI